MVNCIISDGMFHAHSGYVNDTKCTISFPIYSLQTWEWDMRFKLNPHTIDSHSAGDGRQTMSEEMMGVESCLPIIREVVSADPPQP